MVFRGCEEYKKWVSAQSRWRGIRQIHPAADLPLSLEAGTETGGCPGVSEHCPGKEAVCAGGHRDRQDISTSLSGGEKRWEKGWGSRFFI